MSRLARRLFPDVIGTAYVEGEIGGESRSKIIHVSALEKSQAQQLDAQERKAAEKLRELPDIDLRLGYFFALFPHEDHNQILAYFDLCAQHWKSSRTYVLEKYKDREKFIADFFAWKAKQKEILTIKY